MFILEVHIAVIFLLLFYIYNRRNKSQLPGPFSFPFVGNLPSVYFHRNYPDIPSVFTEFSKKWGDIMSLKIGKMNMVVFSEHETAFAILNHEKAVGRAVNTVMMERMLNKNIGINFANGQNWKKMRNFTMTGLKSSGISNFSKEMLDEIQCLMGHWETSILKSNENDIFLSDSMFGGAVFNVVWRLCTGDQRFDYDDKTLMDVIAATDQFTKNANLAIDWFAVIPGSRNLLPESWTGSKDMKECFAKMHHFCHKTLQLHKEKVKREQPKSFFDKFAWEILQNSDGQGPLFTDDQFIVTLLDLFQNAVDTVSSNITHLILNSILHQESTRKVRLEMDEFTASNNISSADATPLLLPYTSAFIFETLRCSSSIPLVAPRVATETINLKGFQFEKGTAFLANLVALNNSKKVWIDPENFRPERFINVSTGGLDPNRTRLIMSFGGGKRVCPAQKFGERMLLIWFVEMMKTYDFLPTVDSFLQTRTPTFAISYYPKPFNINVSKREIIS